MREWKEGKENQKEKMLKLEDEGSHSCMREWWALEMFFKTLDGKEWSVKATFTYENETPECSLCLTLFDLDSGTGESFGSYHDPLTTFKHRKNEMDLRYHNCAVKGRCPNYKAHLEDKLGKFVLDIKYEAISSPHWVAQEITNGFLPIGMGFYRYNFIPKCRISGKMILNEKSSTIEGIGYLEHVWGDWSYQNPLSIGMTKRLFSTYWKLAKWWISEHLRNPSLPSSIAFATDNNIFGYDWIWAIFDNGWTLFYGNILSWIMKGPATGILYLINDDYLEFCNINFRYNKTGYEEKFDVIYPIDIEIDAVNKNKKLHLHFYGNIISGHLERFHKSNYWRGVGVWEEPGVVEGYYIDGKNHIPLHGKCKIEPQRQQSKLGHNSLEINFKKFSSKIVLLKKEMFFQLYPPKLRIKRRDIEKKKKISSSVIKR